MDLSLPPFDEWATISISDSESDDDRDPSLKTLSEEVKSREVVSLSKELEQIADLSSLHSVSLPPPRPEVAGENKDLIEALRKFAPVLEEEVELYQEYAIMKHIGERLRN